MGSQSGKCKLFIFPYELGKLNRGEEAVAYRTEVPGTMEIEEFQAGWVIGETNETTDERSYGGVLLQKNELDGVSGQGSHWIELDDELWCLEEDISIIVGLALPEKISNRCASVTVIRDGKSRSVLAIHGKAGEEEEILEECKAYFRRLAQFLGAMPQREGVEASTEIET
jgi:hypothetical protein